MRADETPLWTPPIEPARPSIPADRAPLVPVAADLDDCGILARGEREPKPARRPSVTHALRLAGHSVHVSVGKRGDGTVREFFVDLHKEGAPLRGAAHVVAATASLALQHGTPLRVVCKGLRTAGFEPAGEVTGHETITSASSLFDLVAQVLEGEDAVERARKAREQKR